MAMTNPTVESLLRHAECRYTLVVKTAKRARQLVAGDQPLITTKETKPVSIAIEEINRGLISYSRDEEDEEEQ